jgi:hypothetical protein
VKNVLSPIFIFLLFIFLLPFSAIAHPGKTDYRGGHKCWKNCNQWELLRGEYHLHDKDWNPIRLNQKGEVTQTIQPKSVPTPEKRFLQEEFVELPGGPESEAEQKAIVEKHVAVTIYEESLLPFNIILLIILAFLMLILLIFVRKKQKKE